MGDESVRMSDVALAFERQSEDAAVIEFSAAGWSIPSGGHLQGIQRMDVPVGRTDDISRRYFVISGSSDDEAYFIVVGTTPTGYGIVQKKTLSYSPYRHAGGIQIIGSYLVVGVEDNQKRDRSLVYFFDMRDPESPIGDPLISIQREGEERRSTAGAVAIVKRAADHLLIVGSWDSDTLDFYTSNGLALGERDRTGKAACKFTLWRTWNKDDAYRDDWYDDVWGSYQNLNLISDLNGRLFLLGYYCDEDEIDRVDLFSLDTDKPTPRMLKKESSRRMNCRAGASFKYGGGAYIDDDRTLISYACERNCRDLTVINEFGCRSST